MVDLVVLQSLSYVAAATGVCIAALYYAMSLRNQNQTRQAQLFMQLSQQIFNKEQNEDNWNLIQMEWKNLDDFYEKYDSSVNVKNFAARWNLWHAMDAAGLLMKKGLIDREMAYYLMGGYWGLWTWKKFEDIIKDQRVRNNIPELGIWFEYLANEIAKTREKKGYSTDIPKDWGAMKPGN